MTLRDVILAKKDLDYSPLYVEEWDVTLYVRGLTGKERARLFKENSDQMGRPDMEKVYPLVVAYACFDKDEAGNFARIFNPEDKTELAKINDKNGAALEKIATAALYKSGMGTGSVEEAKNS